MNKNERHIQKFKAFLHHQGFSRDVRLFECIKFSGGTQEAGFIGWIPYLIDQDQISMIFIPYKRSEIKTQKRKDESHFETLMHEAKQETGIEVRMEMLWKAFTRKAESFEPDREDFHLQAFYASQIHHETLNYLLSFSGLNRDDNEKGRPTLAKLRDAYQFLPAAHLDAAIHTVLELMENIDDPFYIQGTHNKPALLAHLTELHELLDRELRQRLRQQKVILAEV